MILSIIGAVCLVASIIFCAWRSKKLNYNGKRNSELVEQNASLQETNEHLNQNATQLKQLIESLESDKKIAEQSRAHAIEMAGKELELELAKQKEDYHKRLNEELEKMKAEHSLVNYQRLVEQLEANIKEKKESLRIIQQQEQEAEEKEDYIKVHSLQLTEAEKADIILIREFAPRLSNRIIFNKLVWSEYYQNKLQALRKSLKADKTTGIYKISNTKSSKCYIGQAIDIGDRWAQHVKCGLQVTISAPNKFYTALSKEGPENFTFEVLEVCEKESLDTRESYWIDYFDSVNQGYNTLAGRK